MNLDAMDLTTDEIAFRDKVRRFYEDNLTPEMRRAAYVTCWAFSEFEYARQWQKILHAHGWGAPNWPVEHGGAGFTARERIIWEIETARAHPPGINRMGQNFAAPCIMRFGDDAQKKQFLPPILSGDHWWAQGFSEPGAGSDLSAIKLSARADGDDYIVNGSKTWTTSAHFATHIFLLARTAIEEDKRKGLTVLLVDMDSPGILVRPIINIAGEHDFNEVFFTDVRVPRARRLGDENDGWRIAMHLLTFEHGAGTARIGFELRRRAASIRAIAHAESDGHGARLIDDPDFSRKLGLLEISVEAANAVAEALVLGAAAGAAPGPEHTLLNIRNREIDQALTELAVEAIGYYARPISARRAK
ncbi:MAG: acyl-CoA dehydrogenase family protein [Terricaulis sp.]|nr:acyl-CoA dehydrogenase family protein [Terricaulis sp.]